MLSTIARPQPRASVTWSPLDDRWYREIGGLRSDAGPTVVPEAALGVSVFFRAVNVLAHAVASVPLVVYERDGDQGKDKARTHPAYNLLHDQPAPWLTSFRWRHLLMTQAIVWGNHYSQIMPGPGGIGALVPLSPDTTRIVDQLGDGRLVYLTRDVNERGYGDERRIMQDNLLHIRGFSTDGKSGIPLTKLARNAIGLALSAERHGSMFMRQGQRFSGVLSSDASMKKEAREENEAAWQRAYGGAGKSGMTPLLTGGLKYQPISASNKDSQWLEARQFQVEEMLRFLGVPGVLVGHPDKTATYASAEQFFLSFVTHSVRPWTENIAQELNAAVIVDSPRHFADFVLAGLLKGDIKTRYDAHRIGIAAGFLNRNEVRVLEDMNRGPDELDEFLEPMNMREAGSAPEDGAAARTPPAPAAALPRSPLSMIAERSVERLVRHELTAIFGTDNRKGAAARFADNPGGWAEWLATFYASHAERVAMDLGMRADVAESYCQRQRVRFASVTGANESTEAECVAALARITPGLEINHAA